MYRSCIFCSADLRQNAALERFPVGRSVAFDSEKGRLWAVCPRCARWNLAPLQERWEAIDQAERLFRDCRLRAQSENVGMARLRDGTRLIRIGKALAGEVAVWRYGGRMMRRRIRYWLGSGASTAAAYGVMTVGTAATATTFGAVFGAYMVAGFINGRLYRRKVVYQGPSSQAVPGTAAVRVRRRDLAGARLAAGEDGLELHLPALGAAPKRRQGRFSEMFAQPLVLRGDAARMALGRALVDVNEVGAGRQELAVAVAAIQAAGSPEALLHSAGSRRLMLNGALRPPEPFTWASLGFSDVNWNEPMVGFQTQAEYDQRLRALALEIALHEETERRAMQGELSMLEAMWRDAEEIAAIADRLPDGLPPSDPPRT